MVEQEAVNFEVVSSSLTGGAKKCAKGERMKSQKKVLLAVKKLSVGTNKKLLVHDLSFAIKAGEIVALKGKNGAGKSTLVRAIMGYEGLKTQGEIWFKGENISKLRSTERAKRGLFLSWQSPIKIPGLKVRTLIKAALKAQGKLDENWEARLADKMALVGLKSSDLLRNFNEDFSGGESKKLELVQMLMLEPDLAILDEIDAGMDAKSSEMLEKILQNYVKKGARAVLVITHREKFLERLQIKHVLELEQGFLNQDKNMIDEARKAPNKRR